jgi:hypothetical protein
LSADLAFRFIAPKLACQERKRRCSEGLLWLTPLAKLFSRDFPANANAIRPSLDQTAHWTKVPLP